MKRSTAVGHLVEMAEVANDLAQPHGRDAGRALRELWACGELLGTGDTLESGSVIVVLDLPVEELPWLARHAVGEEVGRMLRLGKRPMHWCYRPLAWPAWNHDHRELARFWSAGDGVDQSVIDGLRGGAAPLATVRPSDGELLAQLLIELDVSRRHLGQMLESYWDHDWRRRHKGQDESPEDHLWRAATAVEDMHAAVERLRADHS